MKKILFFVLLFTASAARASVLDHFSCSITTQAADEKMVIFRTTTDLYSVRKTYPLNSYPIELSLASIDMSSDWQGLHAQFDLYYQFATRTDDSGKTEAKQFYCVAMSGGSPGGDNASHMCPNSPWTSGDPFAPGTSGWEIVPVENQVPVFNPQILRPVFFKFSDGTKTTFE